MDALSEAGISIDEITARLVEDGVQAVRRRGRPALCGGAEEAPHGARQQAQRDERTSCRRSWTTASRRRSKTGARRARCGGCGPATPRCGPRPTRRNWLGWLTIVDRAAEGGRPPRRVRRRRQARRFQRRAAARHGRFEPRPRGSGRDLRHQARLPAAADRRLDRPGADPPHRGARSICRARCSSCRASRAARSNRTSSSNISTSGRRRRSGEAVASQHFVAITDPGSSLEKIAQARKIPRASSTACRRSADAIRCCPISAWCRPRRSASMPAPSSNARPRWCAPARPARRRSRTPACCSARSSASPPEQGRDKLTVIASPGIASLRRLARTAARRVDRQAGARASSRSMPSRSARRRSTAATGSSPICGSAPTRISEHESAVAALEAAGQPVVRIVVSEAMQLGQEFFRWEMATAVAGAIIGINPFDQPDVEASKVKTRELTDAYREDRRLARGEAGLRPSTGSRSSPIRRTRRL